MNPRDVDLAMRDPALAALVGAMPADFGSEYYGYYGPQYGYEFGDDFGDEFGAAAMPNLQAAPTHRFRLPARPGAAPPMAPALGRFPMAMPRPVSPGPAQVQQWNQLAATNIRESLIDPNRGSQVKVERYVFPLSQTLTLGTPVALLLQGQPDTTIRPQRLTMNAPAPMFATITDIKIANVSISVGGGQQDAFDYNSQGVGQTLDLPTISPANRVTITGAYNGFTPPGYSATSVVFTATFKGPATIVA